MHRALEGKVSVRKLISRHQANAVRKASLTTLLAHPEHGKSTLLQRIVALDILGSLTTKTSGIWPGPMLVETIPSEVHIWDEKRDVENTSHETLSEHYPVTAEKWRDVFGDRALGDLPNVYVWQTVEEACHRFLNDKNQAKDCILVIEELLTIYPSDFRRLSHCCSIRRRNRNGVGGRIYATTQRPHGIPVPYRDMCDLVLFGRMEGLRDMVFAQSYLGQAKADRLPTLKPGQWFDRKHVGIRDFTEKKEG